MDQKNSNIPQLQARTVAWGLYKYVFWNLFSYSAPYIYTVSKHIFVPVL
jgi:hypothetical protein